MKHGDKIKLHINNKFITGVFQSWEDNVTLAFKQGREEFLAHWESVVEIMSVDGLRAELAHCTRGFRGTEAVNEHTKTEKDFALYITQNVKLTHKDWACKRCAPDGEYLIDGFICIPHRAEDIVRTMTSKECE